MTWQRMLSNIHQTPYLWLDATYYTHTVLDEGITEKIQALNDKCTNDCTVGTRVRESDEAGFPAFLAANLPKLCPESA